LAQVQILKVQRDTTLQNSSSRLLRETTKVKGDPMKG
jgi:hypothetical protein